MGAPHRSASTRQAIQIYDDQAFDEMDMEGKDFEEEYDAYDAHDENGAHTEDEEHDDFDHDMPLKSAERDPVFKVSHSYDRSFSSTTAIHVDDHVGDPFETEEDEALEAEEIELEDDDIGEPYSGSEHGMDHFDERGNHYEDGRIHMAGSHIYDGETVVDSEGRKVSDTFSAMPEDPIIHFSHDGRQTYTPRKHNRTGTAILSSPTRDRLLSNSPQRDISSNSVIHTRGPLQRSTIKQSTPDRAMSAFRNPSSVRAIQMSSPSPRPSFSVSTSSRFRSGTPSNKRTSSRRAAQQNSSPQREFPLVLLHCTVALAGLPYSPLVLQRALPDRVLETLGVLREKVGSTVLERGLLIPHPGDDYELLEERILESLDLKKGRLGKCGHFNGSGDRAAVAVGGDVEPGEREDVCEDCGGHRSIDNSCSSCTDDGGERRKWDIRVYAANGLMRAGAWMAAWQEMEKVDLEVGIWLDDDHRRALEREADREMEELTKQEEMKKAAASVLRGPISTSTRDETPERPTIRRRRPRQGQYDQRPAATIPSMPQRPASGSTAASLAACGNPSSRSKIRLVAVDKQATVEKLPLSTLLLNYFKRCLSSRPEMLLQVAILAVGIMILMRWPSSGKTDSVANLSNFAPSGPITATMTEREMAHVQTLTDLMIGTAVEQVPMPTASADWEDDDGMTSTISHVVEEKTQTETQTLAQPTSMTHDSADKASAQAPSGTSTEVAIDAVTEALGFTAHRGVEDDEDEDEGDVGRSVYQEKEAAPVSHIDLETAKDELQRAAEALVEQEMQLENGVEDEL